MDNASKSQYATATSLTARLINRRTILNIIYRQQPISRADTARETGLQRSTVSLIVDELINEGWVIEGEHGRIPRGRRPIFLHINAAGAGFIGASIDRETISFGLADLAGKINWTKQQNSDVSLRSWREALLDLKSSPEVTDTVQIKGIGIALNNPDLDPVQVAAAAREIFGVEVAIENAAIACGKWFMLCHPDVKKARKHLVAISMDHVPTLGVIIEGRPLRGAHGRACASINNNETNARTNGNHTVMEKLAKKLEFAIEAYDPGVIFITGPSIEDPIGMGKVFAKKLTDAGLSDTHIRVVEAGDSLDNIYLGGAISTILYHFLADKATGVSGALAGR